MASGTYTPAHINKLNAARGFLIGAGICSAFWVAVALIVASV
jgi:hypothetical protein